MLSHRVQAERLQPNVSRGKMKTFPRANPLIVATTLLACGCSSTNSGVAGAGGSPTGGAASTGTSGSTNPGGGTQIATTLQTGGASTMGGTNATGSLATGGKSAVGGTQSAGGRAPTGGMVATGGNIAIGGTASTATMQLTGGSIASGGSLAIGGVTSTAGNSSAGGSSSSSQAAGGTTGGGGLATTGGQAAIGGAAATGGSASTATCTMSNGLSSSSGQLTCYYFGQGRGPEVCNGADAYKLNCGYCGSEGSASGNACNASHNDTVQNISTGDYFAAVPNWGQGENCGLCLSITYQSKTIVATVIDNCASCGSGHVDLSPSAGAALGMGTGTGQTENPTGVTWKSVACPVGTSPIVAGYNGAYSGQIYFQNVAFPVASAYATFGGTKHQAQLTNGMWDFGEALYPGDSITLTDILGHTVSGKIGSNGAGIGVQFPTTC
jgi:hypothetical protein